jgi:cardiolipin hydrolase
MSVQVFDGEVVATGSFNWTRQAVLSNQENVVLLRGAQVALPYGQEFEKLWAQFHNNGV